MLSVPIWGQGIKRLGIQGIFVTGVWHPVAHVESVSTLWWFFLSSNALVLISEVTACLVRTEMGDHLQMGKPVCYVTATEICSAFYPTVCHQSHSHMPECRSHV